MKKTPQQIQKDRLEQRIVEWSKNPKLCKECNGPIPYDKRRNLFCCRNCMAHYNNRIRYESGWRLNEESRKKISDGLKNKYIGKSDRDELGRRINITNGNIIPEKIDKICIECNKLFYVRPSEDFRKYCSKKCADVSPERKWAEGGAREGSGWSKFGHYNGIFCGSTYELCWVIYSLDHGVKFQRFPGYLKNEEITYYPDFLLEDGKTIVEIKGYDRGDVQEKTRLAESLGYTVKLLMKEELKDIFEYVRTTYNVKNFEKLYDDSGKYVYKYVCDNCKKEFETYIKRKRELKYCSKECAGAGVGKNKHASIV